MTDDARLFDRRHSTDYAGHGEEHVYTVDVDASRYVADLDEADMDAQELIDTVSDMRYHMRDVEHHVDGRLKTVYQERVREDGVPGIEDVRGSLTTHHDAPGYTLEVMFPDTVEEIGEETAAAMVEDVLNEMDAPATFAVDLADGVFYAELAE